MAYCQDENAELSHIDVIEESKQRTIFSNDGMCINNVRMLGAIATTQQEKNTKFTRNDF